jgi:hypothetical protein
LGDPASAPLEPHRRGLFWTIIILMVLGVGAVVFLRLFAPADGSAGALSNYVIVVALVIAVVIGLIAIQIVRSQALRVAVLGDDKERAGSYQKIFGAGVLVFTALIAVFGVLRTIETSADTAAQQMRADERASLSARYEVASDQLGSDSAAVRVAGMTALAGVADDWMSYADGLSEAERSQAWARRDQVISTMTAYLKTTLPDDPATDQADRNDAATPDATE